MTCAIKKNLMGLVTFHAALFLLCAVFISNGFAMNFEFNVDRPGSDYKNFNLPAPDYKMCMQACEKDPNCRAYTYVKPGIQGKTARCWLKSSVPKAKANTCCVSGVKNVRPTTGPTAAVSRSKPSEPSYKTTTVPAVSPIPKTAAMPDPLPKPAAMPDPLPKPVAANEHYSHVRAPAQSGKTVQIDTDRPGKDYKNFDLTAADPSLCRQACLNDHRCKAFTYVKPGIQGSKARCWLKSAVPPAKNKTGCISGVIDRDNLMAKSSVIQYWIVNDTANQLEIGVEYIYAGESSSDQTKCAVLGASPTGGNSIGSGIGYTPVTMLEGRNKATIVMTKSSPGSTNSDGVSLFMQTCGPEFNEFYKLNINYSKSWYSN